MVKDGDTFTLGQDITVKFVFVVNSIAYPSAYLFTNVADAFTHLAIPRIPSASSSRITKQGKEASSLGEYQ